MEPFNTVAAILLYALKKGQKPPFLFGSFRRVHNQNLRKNCRIISDFVRLLVNYNAAVVSYKSNPKRLHQIKRK